ncbi:Neopullulanase 2 [compost metagenome]
MYNDQANAAMFQLIGSHDTIRFLTASKQGGRGWNREDTALLRMKLAVFFQMTYIGIPMIYYGDEVGMEGATDPDCRRPMIWQQLDQKQVLLTWYKQLIALRLSHGVLREGIFRPWFTDETGNVVAYFRRSGKEIMGLIINNSPNHVQLHVDRYQAESKVLTDLITGHTILNSEKIHVEIDPFACMMLQ